MAHVLVIDDDPVIAELVQSVLEEGGHRATAHADLDGVRPGAYDVVITDLLLPGSYSAADGAAWVARVRERVPGTPVLVCTAHRAASADAGDLGADAVLTKPFDVDMLLETVERLGRGAG